MIGHYTSAPYLGLILAFGLFFGVLSLYAWQRRGIPGARPFAILMLLAVVWTVSNGLLFVAADFSARIFWYKVIYAACLMPSAVIRLCFALEFAGLDRWLTRRTLTLLAIPIIVQFAMVLTNDWHRLIWQGFTTDVAFRPIFGPGSWILAGFGYALFLASSLVLGWLFFRSPPHRWPAALVFCVMLSTHTAFLLETTNISATSLDLTSLALNSGLALYALALFRFRMLDPILMAHKTVIDQMQAGMVVLDTAHRIVDLNPAAEKILGQPAAQLQRQIITNILPGFTGADDRSAPDGRSQAALTLGAGAALRHYELILSPLKYRRDLVLGQLLLFHDVTKQKHAQAQLIEQQRALATLAEGERLARELHDSLGQVLGYASFQLDSASQLMRTGQTALAMEQLERLAGIIREAHADVREHILNLRSTPSSQLPFIATVEHYLDGFTNNYGIQTQLIVNEAADAPAFPPDIQVQVFRILQEALSNSRKHGQAHSVQVTFNSTPQGVRLTVQDDGTGFDPAQVTTVNAPHFGLQFMRERAEQLGGRLHVQSSPGAGTCILVEVPHMER